MPAPKNETEKYRETKKYLEQIGEMEERIQRKSVELRQIELMAYSISSPVRERVQTSIKNDRTGDAATKIADTQKELNKLICSYIDRRTHIIKQIDEIEDVNLHHVLHTKYIEKKKLEEIKDEIGYSRSQTVRLYNKALAEFEKRFGYEYLQKCS